ncbi:CaiB/BaiF CoA transferase family protein [Hyphococcus luteus]|uniref:CoA transferase n=1 Tax=Hyphococcus luteus TaxID=2058213 RepID=A0A2S7K0Y5_9PROT|nr:CaiB/BaiF CoA-transferase family protein [Marinicaulis flavus]PQA86172.1 CoA transferase [Marinicaulis flavus]
MSVLSGVRIVEFEGLGPGPFCGMLLADLGADVVLIERKGGADPGKAAIYKRGKRSIALDLKNEQAKAIALDIIANADALIEGLRPGVMERLGLGPDVARARNKKLVYGRLTGWGQTGPLSSAAGHDINYAALSGAAWYAGGEGERPVPPPTLAGDVGGGALYLAVGLLAGIMRARETGEGTVVDAAIVDGASHMMNLLYSVRAAGGMPDARGQSMLDGAHFYDAYECADGGWVSIGPLEPKFYAALLEKLGLADDPDFAAQYDKTKWPALKERFRQIFKTRPRDEWTALLEGTDVCFAPVLAPSEAAAHPHMRERGVLREIDGVLQAAAAPRFGGKAPPAPGAIPSAGQHTEEILAEIGVDDRLIAEWREAGVL